MICRFYGYRVSLPNISGVCSPTAEGVSLLGIKESAESFGFEAVPCRIALKNLCADTLPCIMHWNQNHFVVLYKIKGNNFYIYNRENETYNFQKRNEQIFSFFASIFLWFFRSLKHQLNAD